MGTQWDFIHVRLPCDGMEADTVPGYKVVHMAVVASLQNGPQYSPRSWYAYPV